MVYEQACINENLDYQEIVRIHRNLEKWLKRSRVLGLCVMATGAGSAVLHKGRTIIANLDGCHFDGGDPGEEHCEDGTILLDYDNVTSLNYSSLID